MASRRAPQMRRSELSQRHTAFRLRFATSLGAPRRRLLPRQYCTLNIFRATRSASVRFDRTKFYSYQSNSED